MGINSTEVAYNFGQMGSVHVIGTASVTSNLVAGMESAVFCAITFLEDTVFDSSNTTGLIPADITMFPSSMSVSSGISSNTAVTDSEVFQAGITIYGRWTGFQLVLI